VKTKTKDTALLALAALVMSGCGGGGSADGTRAAGGGTPAPAQSAPAPPVTGSVFPLQITAPSRTLQDAAGQPFFVHGDSAWSLIAQLTREEAVQYLEDRRARGFNAVLVSLLEHKFARNAPRNAYGDPPFLAAGNFATPHERYFEHAEYVLVEAERRGIAVLLAPAYLGYEGGDEGWYQEMMMQGADRLREYGRFVARRFANRRNIVWIEGGDFHPPESALYTAVAEGIAEVAPQALHTYHAARNSSALGTLRPAPAWLALNNIYTGSDNVVASALAEYDRATTPFFLIEAVYEQRGVDAAGVRRESYQAVLSGACGHLIGHDTVWQFAPGWQAALDAESARSAVHVKTLMELAHWPSLEPARDLVTTGAGSGATQLAASYAPDRRTAVIYVPTRRTITIDLERLAGRVVRARWLADIPGAPWTRAGHMAVAPPADPGASDWVAVLEAVD
jgi:hypothetical protein